MMPTREAEFGRQKTTLSGRSRAEATGAEVLRICTSRPAIPELLPEACLACCEFGNSLTSIHYY